MEEWGGKIKSKWLANKRTTRNKLADGVLKPFICEMRLREYKSTLIDKGLNYFISVKLLILETIVSQRPSVIHHDSTVIYFHPKAYTKNQRKIK